MTFKEMYTDAVARLHQTGDATYTTLVKGWINRAYDDVAGRVDWYWLQADKDPSTVPNQAYVTVADDCDRLMPFSLRIGSNPPLAYDSIAEIDRRDGDWSSSGCPVRWAPWAGKMYLHPVPDAIYTLNYRYLKTLTALSDDAHKPLFPSKYHEVLVLGAYFRGLEERDDPKAPGIEVRYERMIGRMVQDNSLAAGGTAPVIVSIDPFQGW